jgi:hypothetical protein
MHHYLPGATRQINTQNKQSDLFTFDQGVNNNTKKNEFVYLHPWLCLHLHLRLTLASLKHKMKGHEHKIVPARRIVSYNTLFIPAVFQCAGKRCVLWSSEVDFGFAEKHDIFAIFPVQHGHRAAPVCAKHGHWNESRPPCMMFRLCIRRHRIRTLNIFCLYCKGKHSTGGRGQTQVCTIGPAGC